MKAKVVHATKTIAEQQKDKKPQKCPKCGGPKLSYRNSGLWQCYNDGCYFVWRLAS